MPINNKMVEKVVNTFANRNIDVPTIKKFAEIMYNNFDLNFHPDEEFSGYTDKAGKSTFNHMQAEALDSIVNSMMSWCEANDVDIYDVVGGPQNDRLRKMGINMGSELEEDMSVNPDGTFEMPDFESAMEEDDTNAAYDKGREAFYKGSKPENNPYQRGTDYELADAWKAGYDDCVQDEMEKNTNNGNFYTESVRYYNSLDNTTFLIKENDNYWLSLQSLNGKKVWKEDFMSFSLLNKKGIYNRLDESGIVTNDDGTITDRRETDRLIDMIIDKLNHAGEDINVDNVITASLFISGGTLGLNDEPIIVKAIAKEETERNAWKRGMDETIEDVENEMGNNSFKEAKDRSAEGLKTSFLKESMLKNRMIFEDLNREEEFDVQPGQVYRFVMDTHGGQLKIDSLDGDHATVTFLDKKGKVVGSPNVPENKKWLFNAVKTGLLKLQDQPLNEFAEDPEEGPQPGDVDYHNEQGGKDMFNDFDARNGTTVKFLYDDLMDGIQDIRDYYPKWVVDSLYSEGLIDEGVGYDWVFTELGEQRFSNARALQEYLIQEGNY